MKKHESKKEPQKPADKDLPGYEAYPDDEDIFTKGKEESLIDPDDISRKKSPNEKADAMNEKTFEEDMTGEDLDIPGSEDDEKEENEGSEDEENNYYSLGGEDHEDLEEDKG